MAASAAPAIAASGTTILRVGVDSSFAATTGPLRIGIDGSAPAGCVPHVERVTIDGEDLSIELAAPANGCKPQRPVPFHLKTDPAAATGLSSLPARVYRVRVYNSAGKSPELAAFALIDTSAPGAAVIPESGFWWTQASADAAPTAGTGVSFELQENQIAASLLGFTETGMSTWYFGSATLTGHVARIPLLQLSNGDEFFSAIGSQPDVQPGPRLEIEFISPTRAHAYLVRSDEANDVQVRSLTLSRSTFSTGPAGTAWIGRWVLVSDDGGTTRLFDFAGPSIRETGSFRLVDATNDATLDCRLVAGTQQADACTLTSATTAIADFDQVGYDHFSGHGVNGAPVQLLRVPR